MNLREQITGAVARGWCSKENENKEMDTILAMAIVEQVIEQLSKAPEQKTHSDFCTPFKCASDCPIKSNYVEHPTHPQDTETPKHEDGELCPRCKKLDKATPLHTLKE